LETSPWSSHDRVYIQTALTLNMPRKRSVVAAAPMADILKSAGAERVSDDAARALSEVVHDFALSLSKDAVKFANHAGRKTVKREDIELARKRA